MSYTSGVLRNLSFLCEAVYYDSFMDPIGRVPEPIDIIDHEESSTQAAVYDWPKVTGSKTPRTLIIAFRGTESLQDWKTNSTVVCGPAWPGGDVEAHQGFADSAGRCYDKFSKHVPPGTPHVWLTGHSLGGAMAHVYARRLLADPDHPEIKVTLVTFGSPECFSRTDETEERLDRHAGRIHMARVVNDRDMVVRAPMPGLCHHKDATHLSYSTRQWFRPAWNTMSWGEVPMFLASYVPFIDALADHSLVAYRAHNLEEVQWDGPL